MAIILPPAATPADSASFTVSAPATLTLVPETSGGFTGAGSVSVIRLLPDGREVTVGTLTTRPASEVSKVLVAPGEYLVRRAGGFSVGVDLETAG